MPRIWLGVVSGLIFGALDAGAMIPMPHPNKGTAMLGAFIARFGPGFVICNIHLPWPGRAAGLFLGVLLSLPDAIITKAYVPIMASGAVGGVIVEWIAQKWGR